MNNQDRDLAVSINANVNTNIASPASVTDAFLPLLSKAPSSRLVFVSTILGSLAAKADPQHMFYGLPFPAHRVRKAALHMLMLIYHADWKDQGVEVFAVCHGLLATDFAGPADEMRKMGAIEADEGAKVVGRCGWSQRCRG